MNTEKASIAHIGSSGMVSDSHDFHMPDWDAELGRKKDHAMELGCVPPSQQGS